MNPDNANRSWLHRSFRPDRLLILLTFGLLLMACVPTDDSTTTSSGDDGSGGNGCQPGYCNSNGYCCPSNMRYGCEGNCYATYNDAASASSGRCTSYRTVC